MTRFRSGDLEDTAEFLFFPYNIPLRLNSVFKRRCPRKGVLPKSTKKSTPRVPNYSKQTYGNGLILSEITKIPSEALENIQSPGRQTVSHLGEDRVSQVTMARTRSIG